MPGNEGASIFSNLMPNLAKAGSIGSPKASSRRSSNTDLSKTAGMSVVNLKDLVESYAQKFFKENEKEFYKQMGKKL